MSKQTIEQLKKLQKIKLNDESKKNNLDFLLKNIQDNQRDEIADRSILSLNDLRNIFAKLSNPYVAIVSFLLLILGGWGVFASSNATPGHALYFVRVAKENAKLAIASDDKEKMVLSMKFAGSHARDISNVLKNKDIDKAEIDKLSMSFNKEMQTVKTKLDKVVKNKEAKMMVNKNKTVGKIDDDAVVKSSGIADVKLDKKEGNNNSKMFSVASGENKDELKVYIGDNLRQTSSTSSNISSSTNNNVDDVSTTSNSLRMMTLNQIASSSGVLNNGVDSKELNKLLIEIEKLFSEKKYTEASKKLDKFMNIVDNKEIYVYNYGQSEKVASTSTTTLDKVSTTTNEVSTSSQPSVEP